MARSNLTWNSEVCDAEQQCLNANKNMTIPIGFDFEVINSEEQPGLEFHGRCQFKFTF